MIDAEFWKELGQQAGISGVILAIGGYMLKRWLTSSIATDAAVEGALKIKDQIIKELRADKKELDAEWQLKWDRREKEQLEYRQRVEREFRVFRNVSRATVADIKTLAAAGASTIPEERLETQILVTGMGPLDP